MLCYDPDPVLRGCDPLHFWESVSLSTLGLECFGVLFLILKCLFLQYDYKVIHPFIESLKLSEKQHKIKIIYNLTTQKHSVNTFM